MAQARIFWKKMNLYFFTQIQISNVSFFLFFFRTSESSLTIRTLLQLKTSLCLFWLCSEKIPFVMRAQIFCDKSSRTFCLKARFQILVFHYFNVKNFFLCIFWLYQENLTTYSASTQFLEKLVCPFSTQIEMHRRLTQHKYFLWYLVWK